MLQHLADKGLSDKKTKDATGALMTAMAAAQGLQPAFVVRRMRAVMDKTKAPLAHQVGTHTPLTSVPSSQRYPILTSPLPF